MKFRLHWHEILLSQQCKGNFTGMRLEEYKKIDKKGGHLPAVFPSEPSPDFWQ